MSNIKNGNTSNIQYGLPKKNAAPLRTPKVNSNSSNKTESKGKNSIKNTIPSLGGIRLAAPMLAAKTVAEVGQKVQHKNVKGEAKGRQLGSGISRKFADSMHVVKDTVSKVPEIVRSLTPPVLKGELKGIMDESNHFQKDSISNSQVAELNHTLEEYNITDKQQIQMFLAVGMHESRESLTEAGYLDDSVVREYCKRYEPGTTKGDGLGNTEQGDGYHFRGAGYIQLTGRSNYTDFSEHIKDKYGEDPDIINKGADYVADKYPWEAAGYFWEKNNINQKIEEGNANGLSESEIFRKVSNVVYQGYAEATEDPWEWEYRQERLADVKKAYD